MTVINADAHKPEHLYDENVEKAVSMADDLKLNICNRQVAKKIIERNSK